MVQPLSKESLEILSQMFGPKSTLNLPAGLAPQVIEIRDWVIRQLPPGPPAGPPA
jgi:hypothetical protein